MTALKRLGVLGDVHCELLRTKTALALFREQNVDRVLCVGDVVDGVGDASRTAELLEESDVLCVAGNHERWMFAEQARDLPHVTLLSHLGDLQAKFLRGLPRHREIETVGGRLLLCHGLGRHDMESVGEDDTAQQLENNVALQEVLLTGRYSFVVNGHTHRRLVRRIGTLTLINAGTLCATDAPCCAIIDLEAEEVRFFDLEDPNRATPAERVRLDGWAELF